jgi:hypothetical protein
LTENVWSINYLYHNLYREKSEKQIIKKTMNKKVNQNEFLTKESGPIWTVRVAVYSYLLEGSQIRKVQIKRWKIKEILN